LPTSAPRVPQERRLMALDQVAQGRAVAALQAREQLAIGRRGVGVVMTPFARGKRRPARACWINTRAFGSSLLVQAENPPSSRCSALDPPEDLSTHVAPLRPRRPGRELERPVRPRSAARGGARPRPAGPVRRHRQLPQGAWKAPAAILQASRQVDLFDLALGRPYEQGICLLADVRR
jgi:hypothetical protein